MSQAMVVPFMAAALLQPERFLPAQPRVQRAAGRQPSGSPDSRVAAGILSPRASILTSLALLDGFVDSELCAFKIVKAQSREPRRDASHTPQGVAARDVPAAKPPKEELGPPRR